MNGDKRIILRNGGRRSVSPFGIWSDMDDLFDSMFWDPFQRMNRRPARVRQINNYMPMNLKDEEDDLELTVDMPGVDKEHVKLSIDDDILTISVDSEKASEEKDEGYLLKERSSYKCKRSLRLPSEVKEEDIRASMENGVLKVSLPKVHPKKKEMTEIKIE